MTDISYQFDRVYTGGKTVSGKSVGGKGVKGTKSLSNAVKSIQQQYSGTAAKSSQKFTAGKAIKAPGSISQQKQKAIKEFYKKRKSNSQKSGLTFPVGRVLSKMRKSKLSDRVSKVAGVYLTAVMEYMISEIVENAGNIVKEQKKRFVFPRHVYLAVEEDHEMKKYLGNDVILPTVGRRIYTHPFLKQKANERPSQKNFQVVDANLKDIKEYQSKTPVPKVAHNEDYSDDE